MSRANRSHERTAQEREADRLERERRRAEREGRSPAPEPQALGDASPAPSGHEPSQTAATPEPSETAPVERSDRAIVHSSQPAPVEPPAAPVHDPSGPPALEQETVEHTVAHDAPSASAARGDDRLDARDDVLGVEQPHELAAAYEPSAATDEAVQEQQQPEPPAWEVPREQAAAAMPQGELFVGQRTRAPDSGRVAGVGGGRGAGGRRGGPGAHARRRLTRARLAALIALVAAAALVWFLVSLFQPFSGEGSGKVIVLIPKGSSSSKIGSILARDGVVSSGFFFDVRALLDGKRSSLHSGRFALKHGMSYSAAIDALSKPPPRAIAVKVVIPEGYTRRQIADLVGEDALTGDYLALTKRSPLLTRPTTARRRTRPTSRASCSRRRTT